LDQKLYKLSKIINRRLIRLWVVNGTGSVWFLPQIPQISAESISAKICAISGKQISADSTRIEIEPPPSKRVKTSLPGRANLQKNVRLDWRRDGLII
jgi:hypothetical protein